MSDSFPAGRSQPKSGDPNADDSSAENIETPRVGRATVSTRSEIWVESGLTDTADFVGSGSSTLAAPKQLGDYAILEVIAQGGMGIVYKARQTKLNRLVALKMIRAGELADAEQIKRFYAEAEAAAKLEHSGIVPVYEVGQIDGQHFFSMAFVQGQSLNARVKSAGSLPPRVAARMLQTVAQAVQYAHEKGIVHRDIKPHNILLDEHEQPHIADFGLAKQVQAANEITSTGQILGTPSYMPPEQAAGQVDDIGIPADVYSLGATLYCLLTGRPPFQASSVAETIRQVINVEPVSLRHLNPEIPRDLETICLKCLRKEPEKRYGSARELAQDLGRWLDNVPILARPTSVIERTSLWCWRNPVIAALLVGLGISLVGGTSLAVAAAVVFKRNADKIAQTNEDLRDSNTRSELRRVAAEERRKLIQTHLYSAELNQFTQLWEAGRFDQVYETLNATRPEKTGDELRGWEWFHLYDLAYSERVRFERHPAEVLACALSPDELTVASGDQDGNVLLWDARSGVIKQHLKPSASAVLKLAFSPSGQKLAVGNADSTALILEVETGKLLHTIQEHVLGVQALAFGPTDELLATASADATVKVFAADGDVWHSQTLPGHTRLVRNVWFDKSGQRLASISDDETLRLWAIRDGKWQAEKVVEDVPSHAAFSPDLKLAAYWHEKKDVYDHRPTGVLIAALESKKFVATMPGYRYGVRDIVFNEQGTMLAIADEEGEATVWELQEILSGRKVRRPIAHYRGAAQSILISSSGEWVASICSDRAIKVWPAREAARTRFQGHRGDVHSVAFSQDGTLIASGDLFGEVRLWNRATGELVHTLGKRWHVDGPRGTSDAAAQAAGITEFNRQHVSALRLSGDRERWIWIFEGTSGQVDAVAFSPTAHILANAGADGKLWLWDTATGAALDVLEHPQLISSLAFSPDGRWLVTGCWDDRVRVWDVEQRKERFVLEGHLGDVNAIAMSSSGKMFASGGEDGLVRLWELETGKLVREISGHKGEIAALAFSPDAKCLASGGSDQIIRIWDLPEATIRQELRGHRNDVTTLLFHPTENRLFSSSSDSEDAQVRVWDLTIGREVVALSAPGSNIRDLALDGAGKSLAITADNGFLLWGASQKGHAPPEKIAVVDSSALRALPAQIAPAKVLGLLRRPELMRAIGNKKNPIRPAAEGHELLVLIVSVPNSFLYPTSEQYELMKKMATSTKKQPPGPRQSILFYDPVKFKLLRPDAEATTAMAIAPLPFAFASGFNEGNMRQSGSVTRMPADRTMIGVVWDLPRGTMNNFELQVDHWEPVPIPAIEFENYTWEPPVNRRP